MKIVIAGGTGFLGKELVHHFDNKNNEIYVLSRGKSRKEGKINFVQWDAETEGEWENCLVGSDLIINLTGKSVDCRYTEENKREIMSSRVNATNILQVALNKLTVKPALWLNASTATIYRYSLDKVMTEDDGEYGDDFSMSVAKNWEKAFFKEQNDGIRKVALRISLVIGKNGGVYPVLKRLAKFGVAGTMGKGNQKFAWIHIDDVLSLIDFVIENKQISGPVNFAATSTPTNKEFMKALRSSLKIPFGIPQPKFLLQLGAKIIGTESELILKSRYVYPKRLVDNGFKFKFDNCQDALNDLSK